MYLRSNPTTSLAIVRTVVCGAPFYGPIDDDKMGWYMRFAECLLLFTRIWASVDELCHICLKISCFNMTPLTPLARDITTGLLSSALC